MQQLILVDGAERLEPKLCALKLKL